MSKPDEQIPALVAANLSSLGRLCELFESQAQPSRFLAQSYLARFKLWAGSLGAHRTSGTRSLEYRLRDASSIRKHIVSLLQELKGLVEEEALPFCHHGHYADGDPSKEGDSVDDELAALFDSGSEDEFHSSSEGRSDEINSLLSGIGNVIDCLLRFSVTISNPAPHDHFKSRAGVELTKYFEHYDIQHVRAKYPHIREKTSERLGRMLTYRRRYFKYREDHHSRLKQGLEGALDDGASKGRATTVASSLPQGMKDGAQMLHISVDDRSEISATSYAPSTLNQSELRVPPIPKQYVDGPFPCPFCYVFISVDSRSGWRKHVFRDLRPYTCLVETCAVDHDFQRRKDWARHMLQDHWRAWTCPYGCVGEYSSSSGLRDHLRQSHTGEVEGQDVNAIVDLSSKANVSRAKGPCPLCQDFQITSSRQYQSHVGHHLERLALFVLPTQDDDDGDHDFDDHKSGSSKDIDSETSETGQPHQMAQEEDEQVDQVSVHEEDQGIGSPNLVARSQATSQQLLDAMTRSSSTQPKTGEANLDDLPPSPNARPMEPTEPRSDGLEQFSSGSKRELADSKNSTQATMSTMSSDHSSYFGGDLRITSSSRGEFTDPRDVRRRPRRQNSPASPAPRPNAQIGYEYTKPSDLVCYDLDIRGEGYNSTQHRTSTVAWNAGDDQTLLGARDSGQSGHDQSAAQKMTSDTITTAVKKACDACHRRKVKCDGVNPCRNCHTAQLSCTYHAIPHTSHSTDNDDMTISSKGTGSLTIGNARVEFRDGDEIAIRMSDRDPKHTEDQTRRQRHTGVNAAASSSGREAMPGATEDEPTSFRHSQRDFRRRLSTGTADTQRQPMQKVLEREDTMREGSAAGADEDDMKPVPPPRDNEIRGILNQPKVQFAEEPNPVREGVAPHNDDKSKATWDVPPGARWTKISRKLVNPEALTIGKERFEVRDDFVIVLRVLNKEEIEAYTNATAQLREMRRLEFEANSGDEIGR